MRIVTMLLFGVLFAAVPIQIQAGENADKNGSVFDSDVAPFLKTFCVECPGAKKPEADLSLHSLSGAPAKKAEIENWILVLDKLEAGEMPPDVATAPATNPTINALYNTILHAVGDEREHFNLVGANKENPAQRGPLKELLA